MATVAVERAERRARVSPAERQALILSAHKLVFKIARDYRDAGPAFDDLVQEGCEGLCVAADKFDPSRGVKFVTYASYWIRAKMLSFVVDTHGQVRFGTTKSQRRVYFNLGKARRRLEVLGEEVTIESLARELKVSVEDLTTAMPRVQDNDWSLDATFEDGDKPRLQLRSGHVDQADALDALRRFVAERKSLIEAVKGLGGRLTEVVKLRFLRESPLTLQEIGERWGVSRERVRQVEMKALALLKRRFEKEGIDAEEG